MPWSSRLLSTFSAVSVTHSGSFRTCVNIKSVIFLSLNQWRCIQKQYLVVVFKFGAPAVHRKSLCVSCPTPLQAPLLFCYPPVGGARAVVIIKCTLHIQMPSPQRMLSASKASRIHKVPHVISPVNLSFCVVLSCWITNTSTLTAAGSVQSCCCIRGASGKSLLLLQVRKCARLLRAHVCEAPPRASVILCVNRLRRRRLT